MYECVVSIVSECDGLDWTGKINSFVIYSLQRHGRLRDNTFCKKDYQHWLKEKEEELSVCVSFYDTQAHVKCWFIIPRLVLR